MDGCDGFVLEECTLDALAARGTERSGRSPCPLRHAGEADRQNGSTAEIVELTGGKREGHGRRDDSDCRSLGDPAFVAMLGRMDDGRRDPEGS